ncbi:MAG: hypothetical protein ABI776_14870 [Nocardioidaceae bacterium]
MSTLPSTSLPVTECADALVVWVASTTVGAERTRLGAELSKARGVFGIYAEAVHDGTQRTADALRSLAGRSAGETVFPAPHTFGATPAAKLLPRGARVVGWLEADGYRAVAGTTQPTPAWLDAAHTSLTA